MGRVTTKALALGAVSAYLISQATGLTAIWGVIRFTASAWESAARPLIVGIGAYHPCLELAWVLMTKSYDLNAAKKSP